MYLTRAELSYLEQRQEDIKKGLAISLDNSNFKPSISEDTDTGKKFQESIVYIESSMLKNINNILKNSVVVEDDSDNSVARIGKKVSLIIEDKNGNEIENGTYVLGGDYPLTGEVSYKSPVGKAILGKEAGEDFDYMVNGKEFFGKIISIENN